MKRFLIFALAAMLSTAAFAQIQDLYHFTAVKDIPVTEVKDQAMTGTCWCFGTTSFLEAELIRMGKGDYDLSEMYIVRNNYNRRLADNYLRRGKGNIGQGSICHMATVAVAENGIVPESVYSGINYDSPRHNHSEMTAYMRAIADASIEMRNRSEKYWKIMDFIFDEYLGKVPDTFVYEGKTYTPKSFAESLGFGDMSEYVEITSFSNHPFYKQVPLEVPDNWDHALLYNLPLDEMMEVINHALQNGYTVAWDGDLTAGAFNHARGIALNPEKKDFAEAIKLEKKFPEIKVTQEIRQKDYESFLTVDDHIMHLTGLYKDEDGTYFYKTKNSWGKASNQLGGYLYMSESYVAMRTISILLHKDALPKDIRKKLDIK